MAKNTILTVVGGAVIVAAFWGWFGGSWTLDGVSPPWGDRPSIYRHIQDHFQSGEPGLAAGGEILPDESAVSEDGGIRWTAGALDGVFGHHGGGAQEEDNAEVVLGHLKSVLKQPDGTHVARLYQALSESSTIDYIDGLLEGLVNDGTVDADRLHEVARWLATGAADREPVKAALALLGVLEGYDDRDVILTLGRHEEFTLYAAVAISNTEPQAEKTVWELAQNVDGWGRIQTVERLAGTNDPQIKSWLLREGYKNSIMYEYLAYTCATAGELHRALAAEEIDRPLFSGAGDIIRALIDGQGGPAAGIDAYQHAALAAERLLDHALDHAETLDHFLVLKSIERFLAADEGGWENRSGNGWTEERRRELGAQVEALVALPEWPTKAEAGLQTDDPSEFWVAAGAAEALGIDTWGEYFKRVEEGESYWYRLMLTEDRSRIERAVALAEQRIALDEIATGPGEELGLGPEYEHHSNLDFILQELRRFPGLGWPLIEAGMKSPVIRNRHFAIRALVAWGETEWPGGARAYVEACRDVEPDDEVRAGFEKLLAGESFQDG